MQKHAEAEESLALQLDRAKDDIAKLKHAGNGRLSSLLKAQDR